MPSEEVEQLFIALNTENSNDVNRFVSQLSEASRLGELSLPLGLPDNPAMTALGYALSKIVSFCEETRLIDISDTKIKRYQRLIRLISPFIRSDFDFGENFETSEKLFAVMVHLPFVMTSGYTLAHQMVLLNNFYFFKRLLNHGMYLRGLSELNETPFQLALSLPETDERIIILLIQHQAPIFDFSKGLTSSIPTFYLLNNERNRALLLAHGRKVTEEDLRDVINTKNGAIYFRELFQNFYDTKTSKIEKNQVSFFKWQLWCLAAQQEDAILFYGDKEGYTGIASDLLAVSDQDDKDMLLRQSMHHGHYHWIKLCEQHGARVSLNIFQMVCNNILDKTGYSFYTLHLFAKQIRVGLPWRSVMLLGRVVCRSAKEGSATIVRSVFECLVSAHGNKEAAIPEMSGMVDLEGNNLLFLSILSKNILLIKYLHLQGFHLDQAYNANGRTAIDVLIANEREQGARLSEESRKNVEEILIYLNQTKADFAQAAANHGIEEADIRRGAIFRANPLCQPPPLCFSEQAIPTEIPDDKARCFTFEVPLAASSTHIAPNQ